MMTINKIKNEKIENDQIECQNSSFSALEII